MIHERLDIFDVIWPSHNGRFHLGGEGLKGLIYTCDPMIHSQNALIVDPDQSFSVAQSLLSAAVTSAAATNCCGCNVNGLFCTGRCSVPPFPKGTPA